MLDPKKLSDPLFREALVEDAIQYTLKTFKKMPQASLPVDDENAIKVTLRTLMNKYLDEYLETGGEAGRQVHKKGHGLQLAQFVVMDHIPEKLRHGILAAPGTYPAWIRYSNGGQTIEPDKKGDIRGMAIKVLGVPGQKVLSDEDSQDFSASNWEGFFVRNAQDYVGFTSALATKNPVLRAARLLWFFKFRWLEFGNLTGPARKTVKSLFSEQYWSQVPYRLGPQHIKFSFKPSWPVGNVEPTASDNYLKEGLAWWLSQGDFCFDFMVQVRVQAPSCQDKMPVDDAAVIWQESCSPFIKVAELRIPKQIFDTPERNALVENMFFFPWHCGLEQTPDGSVSWSRLAIYSAMSHLRREINGVNDQPQPDLLKFWQEEFAKLPSK